MRGEIQPALGGVGRALQMSAAALVITSVEGWLITPPLVGKAEQMNAVVVFLGLLLWTWLWGPWGTILAVPMLAIVKAVADRIDPRRQHRAAARHVHLSEVELPGPPGVGVEGQRLQLPCGIGI